MRLLLLFIFIISDRARETSERGGGNKSERHEQPSMFLYLHAETTHSRGDNLIRSASDRGSFGRRSPTFYRLYSAIKEIKETALRRNCEKRQWPVSLYLPSLWR